MEPRDTLRFQVFDWKVHHLFVSSPSVFAHLLSLIDSSSKLMGSSRGGSHALYSST